MDEVLLLLLLLALVALLFFLSLSLALLPGTRNESAPTLYNLERGRKEDIGLCGCVGQSGGAIDRFAHTTRFHFSPPALFFLLFSSPRRVSFVSCSRSSCSMALVSHNTKKRMHKLFLLFSLRSARNHNELATMTIISMDRG